MLVRCCDNEPRECINVARFLSKLDEFLHANDMLGAERCLRYWADEAHSMDDKRGLLTVTNEQIGFYRRQGQTDKATEACYAALKLLDETGLRHSVSGETVVVNVATTLGAYGQTDLAAKLYDEAEQTFVAEGKHIHTSMRRSSTTRLPRCTQWANLTLPRTACIVPLPCLPRRAVTPTILPSATACWHKCIKKMQTVAKNRYNRWTKRG